MITIISLGRKIVVEVLGRPITRYSIRFNTVAEGGLARKIVTRKVEELLDIRYKEVKTEKSVDNMEAMAIMEVAMEAEEEISAEEVGYTFVDTSGMRGNTGSKEPPPPSPYRQIH